VYFVRYEDLISDKNKVFLELTEFILKRDMKDTLMEMIISKLLELDFEYYEPRPKQIDTN